MSIADDLESEFFVKLCVDHAKAELEHIQQQQQHHKKQQPSTIINSTPRSSLNTNFMLQGNHNGHSSALNHHMPQLLEGGSNNAGKNVVKSLSITTDNETCARVRFFVGNPKPNGYIGSGKHNSISSLSPQRDLMPHTQAAILRRPQQIHRGQFVNPSMPQYSFNGENGGAPPLAKIPRRGGLSRRGVSQPRRDVLPALYMNPSLPYHVGQHHSQPYPNAPRNHRQPSYNISHTLTQIRTPQHYSGPPPLIPSSSAIVINNNYHHNYSRAQQHYGFLKQKK